MQKQSKKGQLLKCFLIRAGSTGYGYKSLFGKYMTNGLKEVLIVEPNLMSLGQLMNFITFMEQLLKKAKNVKYVRVITKCDPNNTEKQLSYLENIKADMHSRGVILSIRLEDDVRDRKIIFGNGIIIKIGRGLHYFKRPYPAMSLGLFDYDYRECYETNVFVYKKKNA